MIISNELWQQRDQCPCDLRLILYLSYPGIALVLKSDNLHYNTMVQRFDGTNDSLAKSILFIISYTLLMFCLLNPQTNACEPNPKTTSSDFNR